jgi:four helix bundle protein
MATIYHFKDLECWKSCRELSKMISNLIKELPRNEYNLIDNIQRAARSSTRNIAEGFGRHHHQENIQFCRISRGSLFEIWDDLITCLEEGYITKEIYDEFEAQLNKSIGILNGYLNYLISLKK